MTKQEVEANVEALSRAILSEAHAEAEHILADARTKADAIRKRAQDQAAEERKTILDRSKQEADRIRSQKIATAQLKARTAQLEHREKMLNQVFQQAEQELPSVQQWTDYEEIAQNLLREAIMQLGVREVRMRADQKTLSLLSHHFLKQLSDELNVKIDVGEPLEKGTGVLVETTDGHLQFDNTLQTRLRRMQNSLRSPVYHILMGEAL